MHGSSTHIPYKLIVPENMSKEDEAHCFIASDQIKKWIHQCISIYIQIVEREEGRWKRKKYGHSHQQSEKEKESDLVTLCS